MTQTPAGWYDDPYPTPYGQPGLRYWDGQLWTAHVSPRPGAVSGQLPATYGASAKATTLPDGTPLCTWGRRLGAYLIDRVILTILSLIAGFWFLAKFFGAFVEFVDEAEKAAETGGPQPDVMSLYLHNLGWLLAYTGVAILVNFVYQVAFLRWKAATPGKLMVGSRVRLRDAPGPLTWGVVLKRWLASSGPSVVGGSLWVWLDCLWPLWDDRSQALHDKFAKTNVVRVP